MKCPESPERNLEGTTDGVGTEEPNFRSPPTFGGCCRSVMWLPPWRKSWAETATRKHTLTSRALPPCWACSTLRCSVLLLAGIVKPLSLSRPVTSAPPGGNFHWWRLTRTRQPPSGIRDDHAGKIDHFAVTRFPIGLLADSLKLPTLWLLSNMKGTPPVKTSAA